ncbi:MAG: transcriptional regulator [Desulfobulbaceae bacterium]|nr:transcriptional regulator [Desulfobulbaceae bacterium]
MVVYRLSDLSPLSNPNLVAVALRVSRAVNCLVSALSFNHLTAQIPHEVAIALARGTETPRIDLSPISFPHFAKKAFKKAFNAGSEKHEIDGVVIRVYSPEKTIADDCFKFRNKLGMDIVPEAVKLYKARSRFMIDELLRYGHVCRVANIMKPYLETMV